MAKMKAGAGTPKPFTKISRESSTADGCPYLSVDVVRWYANKSSSLLTQKMAVGTIEVTIGDSKFEQMLGPVWLKGDAKDAAEFKKPVVANLRYSNQSIRVKVVLFARPKDTAFMTILNGLAVWGIHAGGGIADAAAGALAGPFSALLAIAGQSGEANKKLWLTVQQTLRSDSKEQEEIFDPDAGIFHTVDVNKLANSHLYLLLHRGTSFSDDSIFIDEAQEAPYPTIRSADGGSDLPLHDGAWVLVRIRRSAKPFVPSQWEPHVERWSNEIKTALLNLRNRASTAEQVLAQLSPGPVGSSNIYEQYRILRQVIFADESMEQKDRDEKVMSLQRRLEEAKAIAEDQLPAQTAVSASGTYYAQARGEDSDPNDTPTKINSLQSMLIRWIAPQLLSKVDPRKPLPLLPPPPRDE